MQIKPSQENEELLVGKNNNDKKQNKTKTKNKQSKNKETRIVLSVQKLKEDLKPKKNYIKKQS